MSRSNPVANCEMDHLEENPRLDLEVPSQRFDLLDAEISLAGKDLRDRRIGQSGPGGDFMQLRLMDPDQVGEGSNASNPAEDRKGG